MRPVSMLNGDVTNFKNIVVLIYIVSLCHLFELNSADDLLCFRFPLVLDLHLSRNTLYLLSPRLCLFLVHVLICDFAI